MLIFSTHSRKYIWYSPKRSRYPLFIFVIGVIMYFIVQLLLGKRNKILHCCFSWRGNQQSAILVMLSTAAAIYAHTKAYEISATSIQSVVKLNLNRFSVCSQGVGVGWGGGYLGHKRGTGVPLGLHSHPINVYRNIPINV